MADKNTSEPSQATIVSDSPKGASADSSSSSVYPFLEDADTLGLQANLNAGAQASGGSQPTAGGSNQKADAEAPKPRGVGIILLVVLELALIALVGTSAYLFWVNPQRLLEIVKIISSFFVR
jgi:hypothetical protein